MKKFRKPYLILMIGIILSIIFTCILLLYIPLFNGKRQSEPVSGIMKKAEIMYELSLMKGSSSRSFEPKLDSLLTREELAILLVSFLGLSVDTRATSSFTDVSVWAQPYVNVVSSMSIMLGDGNGCFNGSGIVSQKVFYVTILRLLGYKEKDIWENTKWLICLEGFEDSLIENLEKKAVKRAYVIDKMFDLLSKKPLASESSILEQLVNKKIVSKKLYEKHKPFFITCYENNKVASLIPKLLEINKNKFLDIYNNISKYEVQIKFSKVIRNQNNLATLKTYSFNTTSNQYFYPASTVKLPITLLTLEKINNINKYSDLNTSINNLLNIEAHKHFNNTLSIKAHISNIFEFSSNASYNCLYQFLGSNTIHSSLKQKGYSETQICAQISDSTCYDPNGNNHSFTLSLIDNMKTIYKQNEQWSNAHNMSLGLKGMHKGVGHIKNGKLINTPISFENSNYISLSDLHKFTISAILPECVEESALFQIAPTDRAFLKSCMKNSSFANKLFFCGKTTPCPEEISIYNKYGEAYGYLIDTAYISDPERGVEFFLSAIIHVNKNQIYGDNKYEYMTEGYPFMRDIGWIFYYYTQGQE